MDLSYKPLIGVRLHHTYYLDGRSVSDFRVRPSAETRLLLAERGLLFRAEPGRFTVYTQVKPETDPPLIAHELGSENLVLRFFLEPLHSHLFNITELQHYRMGRELFCFDNLGDHRDDSRAYLSDGLTGGSPGDPVALQTSQIVDYRLDPLNPPSQVTLFDRFENRLHSRPVQVPPGQELAAYRYDLSQVPRMNPGRHTLRDDRGGNHHFYYDPALFGVNVFAAVELFSRTDELTPDNTDRVPPAYRFLTGNQLTGLDDYHLKLDARETHWRYIVTKKYGNSGIGLQKLAVSESGVFDRSLEPPDEPTKVIFTTKDPLPLAEKQRTFTLEHDGSVVRGLPNPSPGTPLEGTGTEVLRYSDIYVYV